MERNIGHVGRIPAAQFCVLALTISLGRLVNVLRFDGVAHDDIAQALFVTSHTVQATLASVRERLGATTLDELRAALSRS